MSAAPAEEPRIFSPAYYERLREVEDRHWWSIGMREIERALLRPFLPEGPLDVLDAGCGTGAMLAWLRGLSGGRPVHGIDLSEDAVEHCRRRGEGQARLGSVLDLPYPDGSFDLVHSGDVLQHLPTSEGPARALAEFRRVLRPGGLLYVRANARPGAAGACGESYQRFDRGALEAMVARAGLELLRASYVNCLPSLLDEARAALRSGARLGDEGLRIRPHPPHLGWLNRAMLLVLRLESWYLEHLGRSLPYGHTLACVARRPR